MALDPSWNLAIPVRTSGQAVAFAKWAFAAGAAEAARRGAPAGVVNTFKDRSARADAYFSQKPIPQVFQTVVGMLGSNAPETAAKAKKIAYEYAVNVEGWRSGPLTSVPAVSFQASSATPVSATSTVPAPNGAGTSWFATARPFVLPASAVLVVLLALAVATREPKRVPA